MEYSQRPQVALARKTLPKALLEAIQIIFQQEISGTALVGGTALAGFYAAHRRSDDIDLFCSDAPSFQATILAVRHLQSAGAIFSNENRSAQFFHVNVLFRTHAFTIDVVSDPNLFKVGRFATESGIRVAQLDTLLRMKIAALVSRASEKDLFDVQWLFSHFVLDTAKWVELGRSVDGGVSGESLLASIAGTTLRQEACGFSLDPKQDSKAIYKGLLIFQKRLTGELVTYLKGLPPPPLGKLVRKIR